MGALLVGAIISTSRLTELYKTTYRELCSGLVTPLQEKLHLTGKDADKI